MSQKSLQVGILAFEAIQFLDASPVDLFGMLTREYLEACQLPSPLVELGQQVDFHYISAGGSGTVVSMTSNAGLQITAGLEDEAVKPGKLDILLIPGPDPRAATPDAYKRFLKGHADHGTTILSICTGIIPAGRSGILNGKRVTGPRALLPTLRKQFPEAKWEDKRWMKDGNLWCSGKPTCCNFEMPSFPVMIQEDVCSRSCPLMARSLLHC